MNHEQPVFLQPVLLYLPNIVGHLAPSKFTEKNGCLIVDLNNHFYLNRHIPR